MHTVRRLEIVPVTLKLANDFVSEFHRHNGRTSRNGGKFAIGVSNGGELLGVSIVGNPLSATCMDGYTAEVLRCCVRDHSPKGTCSKMYSRCWQIWRAMGGRKLITYTLQSESVARLRGAGWSILGSCRPTPDGWKKDDHLNAARTWQPVMGQLKLRWGIED